MIQAVTANRLGDGRVVFRTAEGAWSLVLRDAEFAASEAAAAAALEGGMRDQANQIVIDPYLIDVDVAGPAARPTKLREAIRAFGPTIVYAPAELLEAAE
jgi:Protein of unknown function (DUF2849)